MGDNDNGTWFLTVFGIPGLARSHYVIALGLKACIHEYTVQVYAVATMSKELCEFKVDYHLNKLERLLSRIDLLDQDELSYPSFSRNQSELRVKVISDRSKKSSTIVTTNLQLSKWTELVENTTLVAALITRLTFQSYMTDI